MTKDLKDLLNILKQNQKFKEFSQKNPKPVPCAGFFVLDFKNSQEQYTLDYKVNDDIFSFKINPETNQVQMQQEEIMDKTKPLEEISLNIKLEISEIKDIVNKELEKNNIKNPIEKIICVLQSLSLGKDDLSGKPLGCHTIWNLTCMLSMFNIIMIHIDALDGKVLKFEKKSLFDFVKKQ